MEAMGSEETFFYFSFGSNMLKERITIHNPDATFYKVAKLKDFRLDFNYKSRRWQGAVATIVEDPSSHVWGVVWLKDRSKLNALDEQEGVHQGIYHPLTVAVETIDGEVLECRTYQQSRDWEMDRRPSSVYKNVMIRGAREHGLPERYIIDCLEAIVDNGFDGEVEVQLDLLKKC